MLCPYAEASCLSFYEKSGGKYVKIFIYSLKAFHSSPTQPFDLTLSHRLLALFSYTPESHSQSLCAIPFLFIKFSFVQISLFHQCDFLENKENIWKILHESKPRAVSAVQCGGMKLSEKKDMYDENSTCKNVNFVIKITKLYA